MLGSTDLMLKDLFDQLGLESTETAMQTFIETHQIAADVRIFEAPFWTPQQSKFLKDEWQCDAVWSSLIDKLNEQLHVNANKNA